MVIYIALLRGINVSGHNMIKMDELKRVLEELGFTGIRTYIQSGNIIFGSEVDDPADLAARVAGKILTRFGFVVPVVILTIDEMKLVSLNNPFILNGNGNSDRMHVTFLSETPDRTKETKILEYNFPPDEFVIKGKEVYLYCPDGYGNTKLNNQFFESKLKVTTTTRNWKTVETLVALGSG